MKKNLFLSVMSALALSAIAAPSTPSAYVVSHTFMAGEKPQVNLVQSPFSSASDLASRVGDANQVTVTCDVDKDAGEIISSVYFWNDDVNDMVRAMGSLMPNEDKTAYEAMVPSGTYDVMIEIVNPDDLTVAHRFLLHRNVVVDRDMTVSFDVGDAVNKVIFNALLPDGQAARLPIVIDDGAGKGKRDLNTGNIDRFEMDVTVINKKTFSSITNQYSANFRSDGSVDGFPSFDIYETTAVYFNDEFGDDFIISCISLSTGFDNTLYSTMTYTTPVKGETVVKNATDNFQQFSDIIEPSRLATEADEENRANDFALTFGNVTCGWDFTKYTLKLPPSFVGGKVWVSSNPCIENGIHIADVYLRLETTDYKELNKFGSVKKEGGIVGPELLFNNGSLEYAKIGNTEFPMHYLYRAPEGGYWGDSEGYIMYLPTAPATYLPVYKRQQSIGGNVPVTSLVHVPYYDADGKIKALIASPAFVGRCGEQRNVDMIPLSVKVDADGEEVFTGTLDEYQNYIYSRRDYGEPLSRIATVMTNENVYVDGMVGRNITSWTYDENKEDQLAPSLQHLVFKTTDGVLTDRFENAADGVIELMGGDFICKFRTGLISGYDYYWYDEVSSDLKVEYAPYGDETFSPIEVEEIPELRYMPGFGHFYRGSLAGVNRTSDNAWYDLRVTMKDEAGNEMTQLISPAFKAGKPSGINNVVSEAEIGVSVCGRDIIAPDGAEIYNLSGCRIDANGAFAPGIYIVKSHGVSVKVAVK